MSAPESILEEAQRIVNGPRRHAYGHPHDDFTRTGRMWGAILEIPDIPAHTCCLMMTALKVSREVNLPNRENRTDGCGYLECADQCMEQETLIKEAQTP